MAGCAVVHITDSDKGLQMAPCLVRFAAYETRNKEGRAREATHSCSVSTLHLLVSG